jgi:ribosomal protein L32E
MRHPGRQQPINTAVKLLAKHPQTAVTHSGHGKTAVKPRSRSGQIRQRSMRDEQRPSSGYWSNAAVKKVVKQGVEQLSNSGQAAVQQRPSSDSAAAEHTAVITAAKTTAEQRFSSY